MTDLIILHEHRGEPDGMVVSHLPYGPTAYFGIVNPVLRHDIKEKQTMPQQFPHLIFDRFDTKLGERVMNILKYELYLNLPSVRLTVLPSVLCFRFLFPVPKHNTQRVVTFANKSDYISFR